MRFSSDLNPLSGSRATYGKKGMKKDHATAQGVQGTSGHFTRTNSSKVESASSSSKASLPQSESVKCSPKTY